MILFGYLEYSNATFNLHILGIYWLKSKKYSYSKPLSFIIGRLNVS